MSKHETAGSNSLLTPILAKAEESMPWPPGERLFYLVARDGLYRCRQNEFFRSCVKVSLGPSELAGQKPFFEADFPQIPAHLIEEAVGFFTRVADVHGSEAAALFAHDRSTGRVHLIVPTQVATMGGSSPSYRYPIGVHYDSPADLPEDWVIFGDIHCHVDYAAYASHTDVQDELHSAGLHVVVGRIQEEPPEFHVEAVVDGERFVLKPADVFASYTMRRMTFPEDWLDRIEIEQYKSTSYSSIYSVN
jgi:hypothetical protein